MKKYDSQNLIWTLDLKDSNVRMNVPFVMAVIQAAATLSLIAEY